MKRYILSILGLALSVIAFAQTEKPANIWIHYADKFCVADSLSLEGVDSVEFSKTTLKRYKYNAATDRVTPLSKSYLTKEDNFYDFMFARTLAKPSGYNNCDYTKTTSQWCFQRSMESEHFICFWENGMTKNSSNNITYGGYTMNVKTLLNNAEKIFDVYVNKLGFLEPGKSVTDKTKIHMYIVKTAWDGSDWRADGSGQDGTSWYYDGTTKKQKATNVALFHCTTRAATARNGHTPAHEIGHAFQYLTGADSNFAHGMSYGLGQGNDNEWWEDCANWQAYKVYPAMQYSDGEYYEQYLNKHHLNIHHEDIRYTSCFYQDYWCQKFGQDAIGKIWRSAKASIKEDPSQVCMRIFGMDVAAYGDFMYETFAHLTSMDIEGIHSNSQAKIGNEPQRLMDPSEAVRSAYLDSDQDYWIVDPAYCPQNYGYNANPLKVPAAGTIVKAHFRGLPGCTGYNKVKTNCAGWRYGLVAYTKDGKRVYSEMGKEKEGDVSITIPENCINLWMVVVGAPTEYWSHSWTSGRPSSDFPNNNEQWPYAVKFEGTNPLGVTRTYGEFPDDYERKDTTVVINATLAYSSSSWSSVRVQLDTDAASQALGVSTKQLQAAVCGKKSASAYPYVRIAGLNANLTTETNTKTISDTDVIFGHWFNTSGNVESGLYSSSAIYTKIYHDKYGCYVGQQPGKLTKGKTYIVREAIIYTDKDGKEYRAIMEIHLNVI